MAQSLNGNEIATTVKRSQVWQATHDGGGSYLPYRNRSFISFSYGGKQIEDFNLIAYCKGDTMSRAGSASFEDLVTNYDIMDGQYYHGTHYSPNTLSLDLVSDGIDQSQLDDFLHWFSGGKIRELILAEHPNRAIMARVSSAPQLELLPFETPVDVTMGGITYTTSTTLYKGTIQLDLVSDGPFWYAKQNVLVYDSTANSGIFSGIKLNTSKPDLFKEALKIIYEDRVPFNNMVQDTMHFGGDQYAQVDNDVAYVLVADYANPSNPTEQPSQWGEPGYVKVGDEYWKGAFVMEDDDDTVNYGYVAGAIMAAETTLLTGSIPKNDYRYQFFYGGTAPSPAKISFSFNLAPTTGHFINGIANSYAKYNSKDYTTITIESQHKKNFDFTTPNVITSWNKVSNIFYAQLTANSTTWGDLADTLRDDIRHPAVRTWAIGIVNYLKEGPGGATYINSNGTINSSFIAQAKLLLPRFFQETAGSWSDASFVFDAELGTAYGTFSYWKDEKDPTNIVKDVINGSSNAEFVTVTENVGDMLRSSWLIIEDRNAIVNNQFIQAWQSASKTNAHRVYHNARISLTDLRVEYKNRYL